MVVDILCGLMCLYIAMGMAWRMICLFRKNGSCKFRRCPFRRDYTNTLCVMSRQEDAPNARQQKRKGLYMSIRFMELLSL